MKEPPPAASLEADRVGLGIASILGAVFFFSMVDVAVKWLGQSYSPFEIVFFRYLFGTLPIAVFVWRSGGLRALRTRRPLVHALRAGLLFVALLAFFAGLSSLPLAEAIAVGFTAPLFVTALSGPLLGETVGPRRWGAVAVGFLGALVMVRPGTAAFRPEALFVVTATFFYALAMLLTRHMSRSETSAAMLTYSNLGAGLASLPFLTLVWRGPAANDMWFFLLIGVFGGIAAYLVILAYRNAPAAVVAPFDYTALIWGALFGWIVWREQPEVSVWIGAAIVAVAGLYITHREARAARKG